MKKVDGFSFWKNVDKAWSDNLKVLAQKTGLNYNTLRNQRSQNVLPNAFDMLAISKVVSVTLEGLLTGQQSIMFSPRINSIAKKMEDLTESQLNSIESTINEFLKKGSLSSGEKDITYKSKID
ncbi:MAG: hypothetical protein M0Q94_16850 [Candidatus Cloacimonetes bacterium]|nr:hypothetical protein [Candidatus Cloacimonadota bacterium]